MKRLATGAALGGLAVYLYDPALGEQRRARLSSLWRENRDSAVQAGQAASQVVESARPLARRVTNAVRHSEWTDALGRSRPASRLPWIIGAVAIGGALVYFFAPVKGSERRERFLSAWQDTGHSTLEAGRKAARETAEAVRPVIGRVSDQVADAVEGVTSMVS